MAAAGLRPWPVLLASSVPPRERPEETVSEGVTDTFRDRWERLRQHRRKDFRDSWVQELTLGFRGLSPEGQQTRVLHAHL